LSELALGGPHAKQIGIPEGVGPVKRVGAGCVFSVSLCGRA
jgi:hypothetical protein